MLETGHDGHDIARVTGYLQWQLANEGLLAGSECAAFTGLFSPDLRFPKRFPHSLITHH